MSSTEHDINETSSDDDITKVRINPGLIGRYLQKQLETLVVLNNAVENIPTESIDPLEAKNIAEICAFANAQKTHARLNEKLEQYGQSFGALETPSYNEVYDYFQEQLSYLINRQTIDRLVVDLANADHQVRIKENRIQVEESGEALFEPIAASANTDISAALTDSKKSDTTHNLQKGAKQKPHTASFSKNPSHHSTTTKRGKRGKSRQAHHIVSLSANVATPATKPKKAISEATQSTLNPYVMAYVPQSMPTTANPTHLIKPEPKKLNASSSPFWPTEKSNTSIIEEQEAVINEVFAYLDL